MKYGLELEPMVVKEFKEATGPQVINVVCYSSLSRYLLDGLFP